MKCSVIIRTFNEERHIGRLIDGINRQEYDNHIEIEIIVVDSGSTDATVSIARHMGAKIITLPKEKFSFGKALNLGCENSKGEILIFASAHVYPVYSDWISRMIQPFIDENVALVYGRQIGDENTHFSEHQIFSKWFPSISNYNQSTPFCNNANCAIRKKMWQKLNYDEQITGLEDLAWASNMMKEGFRIVYLAEAVIVHVHEETPQKIKNRYLREAIAFKNIYPKVHVGLIDFLRLTIYNIISDSYFAFRKRCFTNEFKNIVVFRFMQFYGTYLGHKQKGAITKELKNRFYYPNSLESNIVQELNINSKKINYN
jgi:glycosyltransferase involved in cell wall biosynthesis